MTTLERLVADAEGLPLRDQLAAELHIEADKMNGLAYVLFYTLHILIESGDTDDVDVLNAIQVQSTVVSDQAKKVMHLALRQRVRAAKEGQQHDQA